MRIYWQIAGLASVAASLPLGIVSLGELFSYSPYENPGALNIGLWLGAIAVVLFAAPVVTVITRMVIADVRREIAWKRTLTPGQRAAVNMIEAAGMEAAHLAWREHNRAEGARLTAKVMGDGDVRT